MYSFDPYKAICRLKSVIP